MNKKILYIAITVFAVVLVFILIRNMINQPGINDMKSSFKEIAKYRNDNNTGPIQRIYVVTVKDTIWKELEDYGNFMPHTKYGNTKVYFFMDNTDAPTHLEPGKVNFDMLYNKNCIAVYEKSAMGQSGFVKYPIL
jgi:hypothetical protein